MVTVRNDHNIFIPLPSDFTGIYETYDGDEFWRQEWYKDGLLHREDGPAVIYNNGCIAYYQGGILHRTDGPAVIDLSGSQNKVWALNGERMSLIDYFKYFLQKFNKTNK